ncbi:MAG: sugar phosphate isomerase/epimerase [Candidatus Kryptonium sp.]|nr:sugar phosphate isomerase/epimerase [Armatimonadota bacterium]MCX7762403.1 sugar phosphate isomerase/epimerase [Candidatus Kryptonium sp.]
MKFGIRQSFDTFDQFEERFRKTRVPIELALPYQMGNYNRIRNRLPELANLLREWGTKVLSVHAPQGKLTDPDFPKWAMEVGWFAALIGVKEITLHPSRCPNEAERLMWQEEIVHILKQLQAVCEVTFALETFEGKKRLFTPYDIIHYGLPMVLDVAHIHNHSDVMSIIEQYHASIVTVHLSAKGEEKHHLPIDEECLEVVEKLQEYRWEGNIILEYLPEYHNRLEEDLNLLREMFEHKR